MSDLTGDAIHMEEEESPPSIPLASRSLCVGEPANINFLPEEMRENHTAGTILAVNSNGWVFRAHKKASQMQLTFKVVRPMKPGIFTSEETRKLQKEGEIWQNLCSKSKNVVSLRDFGLSKLGDLFYFEIDDMDGLNMSTYIESHGPLEETECIRMANCVLDALDELHSMSIIHRDIRPANIMRLKKGREVVYQLWGFGDALSVVQGTDANERSDEVDNFEERRAFMSPEMFLSPATVACPADLWSLGASMFKLVTGRVPFEVEVDLLQAESKAPSVFDRVCESRRSNFNENLEEAIGKSLEKKIDLRYQTAKDMQDALRQCLVGKELEYFSVFLSYRAATDAPIAQLFFDLLNNSETPGGHRVRVYLDRKRLVRGEDWEEGFSTGLLNSICFFPLMTYGSTAAMAALPSDADERAALIELGWELMPSNRQRLQGHDSDEEDNVLKEYLIAITLLQQRKSAERQSNERGSLQLIYPILIGRPQPRGHPDYPSTGAYFDVRGGGGKFPESPSPRTNQAVVRFLREKAMIPEVELSKVGEQSVASVLRSLSKLQGCELRNHGKDLPRAELSKEQRDLIGHGYAGPPVDLREVKLTEEQTRLCRGGLDEEQLSMIKAEIQARIKDLYEVIDRAESMRGQLREKTVKKNSWCAESDYDPEQRANEAAHKGCSNGDRDENGPNLGSISSILHMLNSTSAPISATISKMKAIVQQPSNSRTRTQVARLASEEGERPELLESGPSARTTENADMAGISQPFYFQHEINVKRNSKDPSGFEGLPEEWKERLQLKHIAGNSMSDSWLKVVPSRQFKGILWVSVHRANGLKNKLLQTRDPYVELRIRDHCETTTAKVATRYPVWNEKIGLMVEDCLNDTLHVIVRQNDIANGRYFIDEEIGCCSFAISTLMTVGDLNSQTEWSLGSKEKGSITLSFQYEALPDAICEARKEARYASLCEYGFGISVTISSRLNAVGILQIRVLKGKDIFFKDKRKPDSLVQIVKIQEERAQCKREKVKTSPAFGTSDPEWNEYIEYLVWNIETEKLNIKVKCTSSSRIVRSESLGTYATDIASIAKGSLCGNESCSEGCWITLGQPTAEKPAIIAELAHNEPKLLVDIRLALFRQEVQPA